MLTFLSLTQASSVVAVANVVALREMDRRIKQSDKELDLVNKRLDEAQGKPCEKMCISLTPDIDVPDCMLILYLDGPAAATAEVEGLREALKIPEVEAAVKKMAAEKAVAELEKAKLAAEQREARVTEVQVELQDAAQKLEALEKGQEEQSSRLSKAEKELQEARTKS